MDRPPLAENKTEEACEGSRFIKNAKPFELQNETDHPFEIMTLFHHNIIQRLDCD